ncbi:MAG: hypothetical protein A3F15_02440 [Candidatus Wildermuthbacteria bacterium RIFCSPHIGHO2_12_FULL_40_12]|uniref:Type II secretion system protein n=1 Tax=Candidatus Wildermuthbacteria bacterium RIFCSPHIGHO2_12_FULL_40_12 TaxID=1802457 RepID=A0A1G2RC12_9BACT|nr:MAG: hypothetical protein A3F15_02440 [Candidatus Wildermuthbacteria bacterium RIFCSPHIGHO2_12_FULL_40_12]
MSEKGQSLMELIIAVGIFTVVVSGLAFFILNSYVSGRLSYEVTKAGFLAQEGMEAVRSIRDNDWTELEDGDHALIVSDGKWFFDPVATEEDIGGQLTEGKRVITIESVEDDSKKITSKIGWKFSEGRMEEIILESYLANWQKISSEIRRPLSHTDPSPKKTTDPGLAYDNQNGNTFSATLYDTTKNPSILFRTWELPTMNYSVLTLNYRYHADQAIDDQYAIAYSTNGCQGNFIDWVLPTSISAPDTTISVNLPPTQNLSQLCVKIYTQRVDSKDQANIYTRDVWTEGTP